MRTNGSKSRETSISTLSERFEVFVKTLDGFESIDELLENENPQGKKRADYLVRNREFVIEQKVLKSDPVGRPQKFVDKLSARRGIVTFGKVSTNQIFAGQPDANNLQRRMVLDLTRIIDDNVAAADKQTADTRAIFNIPDSTGILLLLNESAAFLRPGVIHYALANSFQKRAESGAYRYAANDGVILISEANSIVADPNRPVFPILTFTSPEKKRAASVRKFAESMMKQWAAFNRAPLITVPVDINLKTR
jgi:hypothetical protein